jgi:hypothetical protein
MPNPPRACADCANVFAPSFPWTAWVNAAIAVRRRALVMGPRADERHILGQGQRQTLSRRRSRTSSPRRDAIRRVVLSEDFLPVMYTAREQRARAAGGRAGNTNQGNGGATGAWAV